ncbi:MAG: hypothetical protein WC804_18000 [Sphingomonas sp.]|jgi:hypothetical protein|uniref:hypothetical protein n=1 Tax=Sphingomonas sp. TaxID=28214 RepID=UPI003567A451
MNWLQLGGSIVAILILAGVARMLRLGESKIASAADARRLAEEALVGFEARHALVGQDGNAALVAGNGAIAVLKRHGAQVAVRRLLPPLRFREAVEGVTIETGERLFGAVTLLGVLPVDVEVLEAPLTLM